MRVTDAVVLQRYAPWPGVIGLTLRDTFVGGVAPGQCLLLSEPSLNNGAFAQPAFPSARNEHDNTIDVLLRSGRARALLDSSSTGDGVGHVLGPVGRPFAIEKKSRHALLVDGGSPLAPLLYLAHQLAASGIEVTYFAAAPSSEPHLLASLPPEVELRVLNAAPPHVYGEALAAQLGPLTSWADSMYMALDLWQTPIVTAILRRQLLHLRKGFTQVLIEPRCLPCGVGACDLCAMTLRDGYKRQCRDGLVFDLLSFL